MLGIVQGIAELHDSKDSCSAGHVVIFPMLEFQNNSSVKAPLWSFASSFEALRIVRGRLGYKASTAVKALLNFEQANNCPRCGRCVSSRRVAHDLIFLGRMYLAIGYMAAIAILNWRRLRGPHSEVTRHPFAAGLIAVVEWPLLLAVVIWNLTTRWRR